MGGRLSHLQRLLPLVTLAPRLGIGAVAAARRDDTSGLPPLPLRVRELAELAVDELFIAANALMRAMPELDALAASVKEAAGVAGELAHLQPHDLHALAPPPLPEPSLGRERPWWRGLEHFTFPSAPGLPEPLRRRVPWLLESENGHVRVRLLRHPGPPRPWVVALHGAYQGRADDIYPLRAGHLHRGLGFNVALPVLPLHGPRAAAGHQFPGFDLVGNVAATLQAVADVRRVVTWIRDQGDGPIALVGISLGGYVGSLVASTEPRIDTVILGVPVVNLHRLLGSHLARSGGRRGRVLRRLVRSDSVQALDRLVDPLRLRPHPPVERRFLFGGLGDRVAAPKAVLALWRHWDEPALRWYAGGHVGHVWSGAVWEFVSEALSGLGGPTGLTRQAALSSANTAS